MKIALDYDHTFTEDPGLFAEFTRLALKRGHSVTFVTFRTNGADCTYGNDDIEAYAQMLDIPIIYTSGQQKAEVYKADVWIDDMPIVIPTNEQLAMATAGRK